VTDRGGDDIDSFEVKVWTNTTKLAGVRVARFG